MYALNWLEAPKINTCSLNEKCNNNGLDLGILKSITLYVFSAAYIILQHAYISLQQFVELYI